MSKLHYAIFATAFLLIISVAAIAVMHFTQVNAIPKRTFDVQAKIDKLGAPLDNTVSSAVNGAAALYKIEADALAEQQQADRDALMAKFGSAREDIAIGQEFGIITVDNTTINCGLYWGDNGAQLDLGAAVHSGDGTQLPGGGRTVLIGAHTGTFFSTLGSAQLGDIIHLSTGYGEFDYEIYDMKVIEEHNLAACMFDATTETCILYTCYPFGILEHTPYRWFVYAKPVKAE